MGAEDDLGPAACSTRATRSCPYCPRCGTALSSHEVGCRGYQDVVDPSVYVRFPVVDAARRRCSRATRCWSGRRRRGRWSPTPPSPSTPTSPTCAHATGTGAACWPRRCVERVLGEDAEVARPLHAAPSMLGARYEPPFPFIPAPSTAPKGHTVLAGRLRHRRGRHRPRPHRDRVRRGRLPARRASRASTSSTRCGPTAPSTSASARTPGRCVKDADPDLDRGPAQRAAGCSAPRPTSTPTRTAGAAARRCIYYAKPSWYIRTSRMRDRLLAANETVDWHPRAHQARALRRLAGEQRRLGAVARALLGHAAADLALRRRATSTCIGSLAELEELSGVRARGPAPPVRRRRRRSRAPSAASAMRRVPEVIDVWFDSGCDAVRPAPRAVRERGAVRGALPGRLHLRGARPDARLVLLAAGGLDAAVRPVARTATCSASA